MVIRLGLSGDFAQQADLKQEPNLFSGSVSLTQLYAAAHSGFATGVANIDLLRSTSLQGPQAERDKRELSTRDFLLQIATQQFYELLQKRLEELDRNIEKLHHEIHALRDIRERHRLGGLSALTPDDHAFLQEKEPKLYKHLMEDRMVAEGKAEVSGDQEKIVAERAKTGEAVNGAVTEREQTIERNRSEMEIIETLENPQNRDRVLELTADGSFSNSILDSLQKESGQSAAQLSADPDALVILLYEKLQNLTTPTTSGQHETISTVTPKP